jgi:hypothetical protein
MVGRNLPAWILHLTFQRLTLSARDETAPRMRSERRDGVEVGAESPRVVIFEDDGEPRVEVLVLPEQARPGDLFCHCGTRWQVTATRTGDRVLIARPFRA